MCELRNYNYVNIMLKWRNVYVDKFMMRYNEPE